VFPVVAAISVPAGVTIGTAITNPWPITGAWEQRSAIGRAVGFNIEIGTEIDGAPESIAGIPQRVMQIWIVTYVRAGGRSQRTLWSNEMPAQFSWQNNHIVLHQPAAGEDGKRVNVDLVFDPRKGAWSGTLQNEWFSGSVELQRPLVPHTGFPIIGDWLWDTSGGFTCFHVALGADSSLVIWSDRIDLPGLVGYANGMSPPPSTWEWYGELDMDPEMRDVGSNMLFFTGTDRGGTIFLGNVAADGTAFVGSFAHFGNGLSNGTFNNPFTWRRSAPDCATST